MEWHDRIGRRLKLRDLHTFFEVARFGSMAKAAANLALTQPAVSKAIADMEQYLGVRLFDRTPQGVELTRYGRALRKWGVAVFDDLKQAVNELEFLADPTSGELRIGSADPWMLGLLPAVIEQLSVQYPRIAFNVTQGASSVLLYAELRERNIDVVLGRTNVSLGDDLELQFRFDDPVRVAVGEHNPLARRHNIKLADLATQRWVLPQIYSLAGSAIREAFRTSGVQIPKNCVACSSVSMQLALLTSGRYVTVFPESVLHFSARRLAIKFLPVELTVQPPPVGIVTLKGRTNSPVAQLFIDRVRTMVKPLAQRQRVGSLQSALP